MIIKSIVVSSLVVGSIFCFTPAQGATSYTSLEEACDSLKDKVSCLDSLNRVLVNGAKVQCSWMDKCRHTTSTPTIEGSTGGGRTSSGG